MPDATLDEHIWLRRYRTHLVMVVAVAQGITYVAAPDRQLSSDAYLLLVPLGVTGWRLVGTILVVFGVLLWPLRTRHTAYIALAVVETFLGVAQVLHGWVPWPFVLPAGLGLGEVVQLARARRRRRLQDCTEGVGECG